MVTKDQWPNPYVICATLWHAFPGLSIETRLAHRHVNGDIVLILLRIIVGDCGVDVAATVSQLYGPYSR